MRVQMAGCLWPLQFPGPVLLGPWQRRKAAAVQAARQWRLAAGGGRQPWLHSPAAFIGGQCDRPCVLWPAGGSSEVHMPPQMLVRRLAHQAG